jgi:hypothetical protein
LLHGPGRGFQIFLKTWKVDEGIKPRLRQKKPNPKNETRHQQHTSYPGIQSPARGPFFLQGLGEGVALYRHCLEALLRLPQHPLAAVLLRLQTEDLNPQSTDLLAIVHALLLQPLAPGRQVSHFSAPPCQLLVRTKQRCPVALQRFLDTPFVAEEDGLGHRPRHEILWEKKNFRHHAAKGQAISAKRSTPLRGPTP